MKNNKTNRDFIEEIEEICCEFARLSEFSSKKISEVKYKILCFLEAKDQQHLEAMKEVIESVPIWDESLSNYENPYGWKIDKNVEWKEEKLNELNKIT